MLTGELVVEPGTAGIPRSRAGARSPSSLAGQVIAGRYRIDRALGEGGIGVVWLAHDLRRGRHVALKMLRDKHRLDSRLRKRFEREAIALEAMEHPYIVATYDHGVCNERPYLVMEYLEGETIDTFIESHGPVPWSKAKVWFDQFLSALEYVHGCGLLHRDLKPSNVFLHRTKTGTHVRLLDFGLAKFVESCELADLTDLTRVGERFGTPGHMPPEQFLGQAADESTDVYAATLILFEAVVGTAPFHGNIAEIGRQQLASLVPEIHKVRPGWQSSPELMALFRQSLQREQKDRFSTIAELRRAWRALPNPALHRAYGPAPAILSRWIAICGDALGRLKHGPRERVSTAAKTPRRPLWQTRLRLLGVTLVASGAGLAVGLHAFRTMQAPGAPTLVLSRASGSLPHQGSETSTAPDNAQKQDPPGPLDSMAAGAETLDIEVADAPTELHAASKAISSGKAGPGLLALLRTYNREHPTEAFGHELIGRIHLTRPWFKGALHEYRTALARSESSHLRERILRDLLSMRGSRAWKEAAALIESDYRDDATDTLQATMREEQRRLPRRQLELLLARLASKVD